MTIYLVRHTSYYNPDNIFPYHLPVYLSVDGREHAQRVANWFAEQKKAELPIFTSPIVRCVQTAEIIAAKTHSFVKTDNRLVETNSPGLQGHVMPKEDAWKVEIYQSTRESVQSVRERAVSVYEEKVAEQQECILVSHGDPLTVLYFHLLNKELPKELWNPKYSDEVISRGEIVKIEIQNNKPILTRYKV